MNRNTKHRATVATYTRGGWEISVTRPTIHIVPARTRIKHRRICIPSLRGTSLWSACVQVGWNRWRGWKWRRPAPMRLHASGPGECKQEAPRWLLYFTRDVFWHWLRVNACDDRLRGTILQSPDSNTDFFYSSRWIADSSLSFLDELFGCLFTHDGFSCLTISLLTYFYANF